MHETNVVREEDGIQVMSRFGVAIVGLLEDASYAGKTIHREREMFFFVD